MSFKFGAPKPPAPPVTPEPTLPTPMEVATEVRVALGIMHNDEQALLDRHLPPEVEYDDDSDDESITNEDRKMQRLVADDFPFDESQLFAIEGMVASQYACLTGAAGTGKTTSTKKLVDRLMDVTTIGSVNMSQYWAKSGDDRLDAYNDGDDYQIDSTNPVIPTILMCSFTGRATQQIKKNFPESWWGNIMTIHRALGFVPETYEDWDPEWIDKETGEKGAYRNKMRFVPTYTADLQMPWDIILIDEAGMLGLDLWHQLLAAIKPGARIYMIGDINQLPPVHGKSIFGFAMTRWPAYELTHVHRQAGKDNPIVDNAWRVIHGLMPVSEGAFQMVQLKGDANFSSRQVRKMVPALRDRGLYDPIRDTIITPINAHEPSARGYALGQVPLNQEFALLFNPDVSLHPRFIIDGGRERKKFAVGDKVMATVNDYEAGITNGMTGIITDISAHPGYGGDVMRFGEVNEVNARYAEGYADDDVGELDLDSLEDSFVAIDEGRKQAKDKRERGPSSHIVTVRFGSEEHGFEVPFDSLAKVGSLMTAYVVTCHKMQGGESPVIIIIVHDAHKAMLYREWLYTAITRASEKCILLYTESALRVTLNKQTIKGRTLRQKVESFNALLDPANRFDWTKEVRLPEAAFTGPLILDRDDEEFRIPERLITDRDRQGGVMQLVAAKKNDAATSQEKPKQLFGTREPASTNPETPKTETRVEVRIGKVEVNVTHIHQAQESVQSHDSAGDIVPSAKRVIDGGTIHGTAPPQPTQAAGLRVMGFGQPATRLVPPVVRSPGDNSGSVASVPRLGFQQYGEPVVGRMSSNPNWKPKHLVSTHGATKMWYALQPNDTKLLTHQPAIIELPKEELSGKGGGLKWLIAKKQGVV